MKHSKRRNSKSLKVNQVKIQFTNKPITAWGGLATIVAKLLEVLEFRSWVESAIPIEERSNNAKGVYEKVLSTFLTVLSGGEKRINRNSANPSLPVLVCRRRDSNPHRLTPTKS